MDFEGGVEVRGEAGWADVWGRGVCCERDSVKCELDRSCDVMSEA